MDIDARDVIFMKKRRKKLYTCPCCDGLGSQAYGPCPVCFDAGKIDKATYDREYRRRNPNPNRPVHGEFSFGNMTLCGLTIPDYLFNDGSINLLSTKIKNHVSCKQCLKSIKKINKHPFAIIH
jgi:hypothetical protein